MKKKYLNTLIFIMFFLAMIFKNNIFILLGNIRTMFVNNNFENECINDSNDNKTKIIYRSMYSFNNEFIINKGSNDGVIVNDAVTSGNSLVGVVSKVNNNTSVVSTLNSKNITVKVNTTYGVIKEYDEYKNAYLISEILNYDDVRVNDKVYSSKYSLLQENIYIGYISEIINDDLSKKIYVKNDLDMDNLLYVSIRNSKVLS